MTRRALHMNPMMFRNTPLFLTVSLSVGLSCQTPSRSISEDELLERRGAYLESYQESLHLNEEDASARIQAEYAAHAADATVAPQSYDLLVLSGGGAFGAFGAGFLQGWGSVEDPEFARPEFDTVSGISTGALIAPFAFVGTDAAYERVVELYGNPAKNLVRKRGLIPYLPGNISVYNVKKLHKHIRASITPELVEQMAAASESGRQLLVGATNVDYGLLRVWDLGREARDLDPELAIESMRDILLASAAIPGMFPPILIDDLLYVDGGASMQMVGGIDQRDWAYSSSTPQRVGSATGPPVRIRLWIIVNQKLLADTAVTKTRWTSIAARSLNVLVRTSTLQSIQDTVTFVALLNQRPEFDARVRYVAIPQDHVISNSDEMFSAETMRELVAIGREMGADPSSWRTRALRPGAPFELDSDSVPSSSLK